MCQDGSLFLSVCALAYMLQACTFPNHKKIMTLHVNIFIVFKKIIYAVS